MKDVLIPLYEHLPAILKAAGANYLSLVALFAVIFAVVCIALFGRHPSGGVRIAAFVLMMVGCISSAYAGISAFHQGAVEISKKIISKEAGISEIEAAGFFRLGEKEIKKSLPGKTMKYQSGTREYHAESANEVDIVRCLGSRKWKRQQGSWSVDSNGKLTYKYAEGTSCIGYLAHNRELNQYLIHQTNETYCKTQVVKLEAGDLLPPRNPKQSESEIQLLCRKWKQQF